MSNDIKQHKIHDLKDMNDTVVYCIKTNSLPGGICKAHCGGMSDVDKGGAAPCRSCSTAPPVDSNIPS